MSINLKKNITYKWVYTTLHDNIEEVVNILDVNNIENPHKGAGLLCEAFSFKNANGGLQEITCNKAISRLIEKGCLFAELFEKNGSKKRKVNLNYVERAIEPLSVVIDNINQVSVCNVETDEDYEICRAIESIECKCQGNRHVHVGHQTGYLFKTPFGIAGAATVFSALPNNRDRDLYVDWSWDERYRQIGSFVRINITFRENLSESLIPEIMTILLERIIDYFSRTYGYTPLVFEIIGPASMEKYLLESNWKKLLKSNKVESNSNSESFYTYLYEVDKNFRERLELRSAPKFILAEQIKELESTPFKEVEDCNLGDSRRVNRLGTILEGFFKNPGGFHQYFSGQGKSQEKAYYRFIDNTSDKVNIDTILGGHTRKTLCRMCGSDKLLCIGDGSDLNYNKIGNSCICLGDISTRSGKKYKGLHIHTLILCTSDGIFLGILQLACSAPEMRDPKDPKLPTNRPDEEQKSFIWIQQLRIVKEIAKQHPEKSFIYVCDREADMLSLYKEVDGCKNVDFIVRASQDRNIYHKHDMTDKIFDKIDRGMPIGSFSIKVNRQSDRGEKKRQQGKNG